VQSPETGTSRGFQGLCAGPATVRVLNDGVDICQSPQQVNLVCGQNNLTSACPC